MKNKFFKVLAAVLVMAMTFGVFGAATLRADEENGEMWADDTNDGYSDNDNQPTGYATLHISAEDRSMEVGCTNMAYATITTNMSGDIVVKWSSSDNSIAAVQGDSHDATVRGVNPGSAKITAKLFINGNLYDSDSYTVKVKASHPEHEDVNGIWVDPKNITIQHGAYAKITAHVIPANATHQGVTYASNNPDVVDVDANGVIYGAQIGSATIVCRSKEGNYACFCDVYVKDYSDIRVPVTGMKLSSSAITMTAGQTIGIAANVFPQNATNKNVSWSSNNPAIATVSDGIITAKAAGNAVISAWTDDGGFSSTCAVTVKDANNNGLPAPKPIRAINTRDPQFCYNTVLQILNAAPNATIVLQTVQPMSYDVNVAAALASRPDVTLNAIFPFQGHVFSMTVPKGYNLTAHLDRAGYAEWLNLCLYKDGIVVTQIQ